MAGVPAGRLSIEIVAEIARLQSDLDKAKRAVKAASGDIAKSARAANDNIGRMGSTSKLASHHVQNLSFQLQDIFIGLKSGQKPMTVFLQQGSQIAGIMGQAGIGVGSLVMELGRMATGFLAAHPILLAAAAAVGLISAAVGLVTAEINKSSDVTVTWQDVLLGAFDVVKDSIYSNVNSAFDAMGLKIGDVWDAAVKYTKIAINFIISAAVSVPRLIAATYDKIPAAFGDAFYSAANMAIDALNWLAQKSAAPINAIIAAMNAAFGTEIPKVVIGGIENIENPYKGALSALGKAGSQSLISSFKTDWIANVGDALSDAAQRRARLREAAEKAGEKAGKAGGKKMGGAMGKAAAEEFEDVFGKELAKTVQRLTKELAKGLDQTSLKDISEQINRQREAEHDRRIDELENIASLLTRNLHDFATIIGGGPGQLLAGVLNTEITLADGSTKTLADQFGKELAGIFGVDGSKFADTITTAMQGAFLGATANQTILGGGGSSFGASIGGALGAAAGKEFLGKTLGAFAGPVGGIVGGLLGGLVGGLFGSTKKGKATISGGAIGISGNSSSREDAVASLAGSATDALRQIADALGAELDLAAGNVTIAIRKKSLRVDPTGQGNTKTSKGAIDFGQDQEAALKYAISDLISDGVLTGISDAMKRLVEGSGDLDAQIQKALDFKGVFDYLEQAADPAAYATKQLNKELDYLRSVFDEAGASADDLAKLEEYSALRRKEILEQFNADAESLLKDRTALEIQILTAQGRITEAVTQARKLETDALDASLVPLQNQFYALQDAAQQRELEIQLMEALGLAEEALDERRADYLKTLPENLRGIQMQIYAAQDAKTAAEEAAKAQDEYNSALSSARSDLVSAYNREVSALQTTADRFRGFADTLRDFRSELYGADSGLSSTTSLLANLIKVGSLAARGNEAGITALPGAGRDYLSSLRNTATSSVEYARGVALVARYADQGIAGANSQASAAERQIRLLEAQVSKLTDLDEGTLTLSEAMKRVSDLLESPVVPAEPTPVALPEDYVASSHDGQQAQIEAVKSGFRDLNVFQAEMLRRLERLEANTASTADNTKTTAKVVSRWDDGGRARTVVAA